VCAAIEPWLPHRPPFRFVDELIDVAGERGEFALHLGADDERLQGGVLPTILLLEALAQGTAAFFGYRERRGAEPGMLVELSSVELLGTARAGETVRLIVERRQQLGALARFAGEAHVGTRLLARANVTVARGLTSGATDA
jgi:3-hydroxymyristoyl/3-hydroxydecanoyl-(acyl carrier protein) dehydratase